MVPLAVNVSIAMGVLLFAFSVYLTRSAAGSEFSIAILSLAFAGSVFVRGVLAIPIGRYVDRFGIRLVVAVGSVLGAAGLVGFGVASEPWQVLGSWWFLIGPAGSMIFFEPAFVAVNQWVSPEDRPRALGTLTLIGGASGVVFIPGSQWVVSAVGWRSAVIGLGVLLLISGITTVTVAIPSKRGGLPTSEVAPRLRLSELVHDRPLILFTASMMISAFAIQAVIAHRIALFEEVGITPGVSTFWAAIGTAISLPTRWFVPILSKRVDVTSLHVAGIALVAVGTGLLIAPASTIQMVAHFVVFGLSFATLLPLRALAMSHRFAGPNYGSIMGAQWMMIMFAGAAGPGIVGVVKQATGSYQVPVAAMVVLLGVSIILIRLSEAVISPDVGAN